MKTKFLALWLAASVIVISCKKDADEPINEETFTSLEDFINSNQVEIQSFTVTAENGGVIICEHGSVITIPANVFLSPSGMSITGDIKIIVKEGCFTFRFWFPLEDRITRASGPY